MAIFKIRRPNFNWFKKVSKNIKNNLKHKLENIKGLRQLYKTHKTGSIKHKKFSITMNDANNVENTVNALPDDYWKLKLIKADLDKQFASSQTGDKDWLDKYIPSFKGLLEVDAIAFNRLDYIEHGNGDWSEIMYIYDGDLVLSYDFENKFWFYRDFTYNPVKEFQTNGSPLVSLKPIFSKNDQVFGEFIDSLDNSEFIEYLEDYSDTATQLIDYYNKKS